MQDAFRHHNWATLRLLDSCSSLTDEQLNESVSGTYGSVIDTLRHLVESDAWYLFRLSEERMGMARLEDDLGIGDLLTFAAANAAAWEELLAERPDPERQMVSRNSDGETVHTYVGIRLAQALERSIPWEGSRGR